MLKQVQHDCERGKVGRWEAEQAGERGEAGAFEAAETLVEIVFIRKDVGEFLSR